MACLLQTTVVQHKGAGVSVGNHDENNCVIIQIAPRHRCECVLKCHSRFAYSIWCRIPDLKVGTNSSLPTYEMRLLGSPEPGSLWECVEGGWDGGFWLEREQVLTLMWGGGIIHCEDGQASKQEPRKAVEPPTLEVFMSQLDQSPEQRGLEFDADPALSRGWTGDLLRNLPAWTIL